MTANSASGNISVLLGNGAGGFGAPTVFRNGPGIFGTDSIAVADFNKDNKLDVAIANSGTQNISVLLGNGSGGFGTPNLIQIGQNSFPSVIIIADFNSDGRPDIAATDFFQNSVYFVLGNGNGTFDVPKTISLGPGGASISVEFNRCFAGVCAAAVPRFSESGGGPGRRRLLDRQHH